MPTTYGKLQPPLGNHRLKIVEFVSVLLILGIEAVEKELIQQGAIKLVVNLFFEYPFNNFLHYHVENIIASCLESKTTLLLEYILQECDIVRKILAAEKNPLLPTDSTKENSDWVDWLNNVLSKRNATENVYHWSCGRPTTLQDHVRDSDDEDFQDKDFDVAALASSLSQAFRLDTYANDDIEEAQGSFERDEEDVCFDDESAEVIISSLHLGDDHGSSLFTNSNWFSFDNDRGVNKCLTDSVASSSPNSDETLPNVDEADNMVLVDDSNDTTRSIRTADQGAALGTNKTMLVGNGPFDELKEDSDNSTKGEDDKPLEWVEWRETPRPDVLGKIETEDIPNSDIEWGNDKYDANGVIVNATKCGPSSRDEETDHGGTAAGPKNTSKESLHDSLKGSEIIDTDSSSQQPQMKL